MFSDIYVQNQIKSPGFSLDPTCLVALKSIEAGDDAHVPFNPFTFDGSSGVVICPYRDKDDLTWMISKGKANQAKYIDGWTSIKARLMPVKFFDLAHHRICRVYNSKNKPHYNRIAKTPKGKQTVKNLAQDDNES